MSYKKTACTHNTRDTGRRVSRVSRVLWVQAKKIIHYIAHFFHPKTVTKSYYAQHKNSDGQNFNSDGQKFISDGQNFNSFSVHSRCRQLRLFGNEQSFHPFPCANRKISLPLQHQQKSYFRGA
ncbi:MAG: hypothetical protein J6O23_04915 [Prevotella sp.]|nr:hypothetical protein [Prevotella sp.]